MKNLKIDKNKGLLLIFFLMIVVALFLMISSFFKDSQEEEILAKQNIPASGAEYAYAASKSPTLREDDKIFGSKEAPVKIFVYEDNASIFSAQLADTLDRIYIEEAKKVAIIIRPFISQNSVDSLEAALAIDCAADQGKWVGMRALIFSKVKNEELDFGKLNDYAKQIGLNENKFFTCLTNQEKLAKIEELSREAEQHEVMGAPTIFIDNEMILGARPYEDYVDSNGEQVAGLKTIISKKLK